MPSGSHISFHSMRMSSESFRMCARAEFIDVPVVPPLHLGHPSAATSTGSTRQDILSWNSNSTLAPKSGTSAVTEELLFEVLHHATKGRFGFYGFDVGPASECGNIAAQASARDIASATSDTMQGDSWAVVGANIVLPRD